MLSSSADEVSTGKFPREYSHTHTAVLDELYRSSDPWTLSGPNGSSDRIAALSHARAAP